MPWALTCVWIPTFLYISSLGVPWQLFLYTKYGGNYRKFWQICFSFPEVNLQWIEKIIVFTHWSKSNKFKFEWFGRICNKPTYSSTEWGIILVPWIYIINSQICLIFDLWLLAGPISKNFWLVTTLGSGYWKKINRTILKKRKYFLARKKNWVRKKIQNHSIKKFIIL